MDLSKLLKVQIYFKIVGFFHENPASIDTPRGVAAWTGESRQDVKKALLRLARFKILTAHKVSSTTAYSYTRDLKLIKKINTVIKKLGRRKVKMGRGTTAVFLALVLSCALIFPGCAGVSREVLDEKEAVIQNLNFQIEDLKKEISELKQSNERLMDEKSELEERLSEKEDALLQKGAEEQKIK